MIAHRTAARLLTVILALYLCVPVSFAATNIVFSPSDHAENDELKKVSNDAAFAPICSGDSPLRGLDLVRGFAGASMCNRERVAEKFRLDVEYILLIDDSRPMSDYLQSMLAERGLLRDYQGRQIVSPRVESITVKGSDTGMNILVVGEMAFREQGSDRSHMVREPVRSFRSWPM